RVVFGHENTKTRRLFVLLRDFVSSWQTVRGLMQSSISARSLLEPRSLSDALHMLRDEGPLTPLAGCTDLYVSLNFGTLKDQRFLNLWRLDTLRTIQSRRKTLTIGALATFTDLIRSPLV